MINYNSQHKVVLDDLLLGNPNVREGKMFGFPAYFVGKKLCICLYEQGVGVKIPEQFAENLLKEDHNTIPFQPMGKSKMREWVQINLSNSEDYRNYKFIFDASIRYVLAIQEKVE